MKNFISPSLSLSNTLATVWQIFGIRGVPYLVLGEMKSLIHKRRVTLIWQPLSVTNSCMFNFFLRQLEWSVAEH